MGPVNLTAEQYGTDIRPGNRILAGNISVPAGMNESLDRVSRRICHEWTVLHLAITGI